MFALTTFADVVAVAKTFGADALAYAMGHSTLNQEANQLIVNCRRWAGNPAIEIVNVNDGNDEFTITAHFTREKLGGNYYHNDINIVRTGKGAFSLTLSEAVNQGEISVDTVRYVLEQINARNEAADALGV